VVGAGRPALPRPRARPRADACRRALARLVGDVATLDQQYAGGLRSAWSTALQTPDAPVAPGNAQSESAATAALRGGRSQ
jgi:hypothetical protein